MKYRKTLLVVITLLVVLLIVFLFSWKISPQFYQLSAEEELHLVQITIENFENLLKNGINEDNYNNFFNYFSPDGAEQDKIYRNTILSDIQNKKEQLNFKVLSYEILALQKNEKEKNYQTLVQEVRDYGERSNDYGNKFSRMFILEDVNNEWKIKEYKKINSNNSYSGSLAGSRKYDGFYP